jgi:hypothetical protein
MLVLRHSVVVAGHGEIIVDEALIGVVVVMMMMSWVHRRTKGS